MCNYNSSSNSNCYSVYFSLFFNLIPYRHVLNYYFIILKDEDEGEDEKDEGNDPTVEEVSNWNSIGWSLWTVFLYIIFG